MLYIHLLYYESFKVNIAKMLNNETKEHPQTSDGVNPSAASATTSATASVASPNRTPDELGEYALQSEQSNNEYRGISTGQLIQNQLNMYEHAVRGPSLSKTHLLPAVPDHGDTWHPEAASSRGGQSNPPPSSSGSSAPPASRVVQRAKLPPPPPPPDNYAEDIGTNVEEIANMEEMGFTQSQINEAMFNMNNDPVRAADYLCNVSVLF